MISGNLALKDAPAAKGEIFAVDDDPAIRRLLDALFSSAGYVVTFFADGPALLAAAQRRTPVCILLDVHIPGPSGLEILKQLATDDYPAPAFVISGRGDIAMAVEAVKHGALDFIEKPFRGGELVRHIEGAVEAWGHRRRNPNQPRHTLVQFPGREPLTRREREVLAQLAGGASNKGAARQLQISPRTIEVHRARIMEKLGAKNLADVMRILMSEGRGPMFGREDAIVEGGGSPASTDV
jgi:FixJ family two-component response regulator